MAGHDAREEKARAQLAPAVYDYFAGGAGDEQTVGDNVEAWRRLALATRALGRPTGPDTSIELLGARLAAPVLLAPIAAQRLLHPDGELASARAAESAGTIFCLSTRATTDLAEVAEATGAPLWFQLYMGPDRDLTARILGRLAPAGYRCVVLTADMPVPGERDREVRHGPIPLPDRVGIADHLGGVAPWFKPTVGGWRATLTWSDVAWVRERSGLPVAVKGVMTGEDAALAVAHGADAIVVSNHGGRQLDGCLPTAAVLPEVVAAVGGVAPVLVDGGIRNGADVLRALALGADAALVGRPYAWALACDGTRGVEKLLEELAAELAQAMTSVGCGAVADIGADAIAG
jgi:4-hydroxymandelate oxidase